MTVQRHQLLATFIWRISKLLRGPYKRNEYRKVILPLTVLSVSIAFLHRQKLRARLKRCARALFPVTLSRWNAADRTTVISPMPNGAAWSRLFPPPNTAGVPPNTLGVRS